MWTWTLERRKVEKVILELVALSQKARRESNNVAANAYEKAIRLLRSEFQGR